MFLIKFLFYFSLSFLILNVPIGGDALFYKLENVARPVTEKVFSFMREQSKEGIDKGAAMTKKLFSNTIPPKETKKDVVKVKKSSTKKPLGKYTPEEQQFLENILKKAQ